ncbi:MAG: acyltransferase [Deltaproteobacteria bacterium]|nr:acyltransferase [Deltaproteobacteria bacterium]
MSSRRPELDGLRAVAFFSVFFQHANHARWVPGGLLAGRYGVDVFFALSAYLLCGNLLRERAAGGIDTGRFYLRRVLRIWPLYFLALALSALLFPAQRAGLWPFVVFAGNVSIAAHGSFDTVTTLSGILWSTCQEEQFYLVAPLLVFAGRRGAVASALGLVALSVAVRAHLDVPGATDTVLWVNPLARLDALAGGVLLAALDPRSLRSLWRVLLFVAGAALCALAARLWSWTPGAASLPQLAQPLAGLGAAAIVAAAATGESRLLGNRVMQWLGERTYALYVFHTALVAWLGAGKGLAAVVLLAAVSYRFLERPILARTDAILRRFRGR